MDQLVDGRGLDVASHAGNAKAMDPETDRDRQRPRFE